eukprot:560004-Alexandrium_andersonii.AAC.1
MSASLVGSEMCIRDRPGKELESCAPDEEFTLIVAIALIVVVVMVAVVAVSYTHLTLPTICSV